MGSSSSRQIITRGRTKLRSRPHGRDNERRHHVLNETISQFEAKSIAHFHNLAAANLSRWRQEATARDSVGGSGGIPTESTTVRVLPGDWGEVTLAVTKEFGQTFAVLNMANAHCPGGGYLEGMVAQEENMFRRTNCHFEISEDEMTADELYKPELTDLINGVNGRVYLDTAPRVCIRGAEDRSQADLGYPWLADENIFPFLELRSAADDLRDGNPYDPASMQKKIGAQLDTLIEHGIRHVVLSAFGCGAFGNPASDVARIYKEEVGARQNKLDYVVFGIFHAGYGPDNFTPFAAAFES